MGIERVLLQDFINDLCFLIDNGYRIDIQTINSLIENRELVSYFKNNYPSTETGFTLQFYSFTGEHCKLLQTLIEKVYYGYSNSNSFGIYNNGLVYLIVLANTYLRNQQ